MFLKIYIYWGLIQNENVVNTAEVISFIAFVAHIVIFIMQITGIKRTMLDNK